MSQQTQIQRVVERWSRFLERFPTVEALAAASLADVLEEWSGLGYNRRTRSLHECAKLVADTGRPDSVEGLQALPGIGPYTAGTTGAPIFDEALAWIECEVRETVTFGSHTLFIGELVDCAMNDAEAPRAAAMSDTRMKYGGVPRKAHG
jgi:A/G-specific adenine glycosylase